jgi:RecJ-like exonuclease
MKEIRVTAGPFVFTAHMETDAAPQTCAAFVRLLPFR